MIKSYPIVTDEGIDTGSEVSFKWKDVIGVQKLFSWEYNRSSPGDPNSSRPSVVPECCTIYVGRHELNIRADYDELIKELKELDEESMYE